MAVEFKVETVRFSPLYGKEQKKQGHVTFWSNVRTAEIALRSFRMAYSDSDHHLFQEKIKLSPPSIIGSKVHFEVEFLLRDSSGPRDNQGRIMIDDRYEGEVEILVIADLE